MARIRFPDEGPLTEAQQRVHDRIVAGRRRRIVGPLRAALINPELADRWQALGALLRFDSSLSPRLTELAILVTARACQAPVEWYLHGIEARRAGLEEGVIDALLAQAVPPGLDAAEAAVHRFVAELNAHLSVSAATHAAARTLLGDVGVVELTALVGYYTMVSMTLNAHEIPMPDGVEAAFPTPQDAGAFEGR